MSQALPRFWRFGRSGNCVGGLIAALLVLGTFLIVPAQGDNSLLETHRQEITDLTHKGEFAEAATLYQEVLKDDPTRFQDHLALAQLYGKLGRRDLELAEYQTVRDLIPNIPQNSAERSALAEAERRIHILDPSDEKLRAAIAEFDTKLQTLERSCRDSHDKAGFERIQQVRQQLAAFSPTRAHALVTVSARVESQNTGLNVIAGKTYRVVAMGIWDAYPDPAHACDANGIEGPTSNGIRSASLVGTVGGGSPFPLGKDVTFVATASGPLALEMFDSNKTDNHGELQVYVGIVPADQIAK